MIIAYAVCNVSVAPLRAEPSHRAEQVSQLLFGEKAEVYEVHKGWAKVKMDFDGYIGWCLYSQLQAMPYKDYCKPVKHVSCHNKSKILYPNGDELWVPMGGELNGLKYFQQQDARFKGNKIPAGTNSFFEADITMYAKMFLRTPYLWGGRTVAGIDCSGLSQVVFKLCGKGILRDASQQVKEGVVVDFLQQAQCGDLAFFDNEDGKITHVGILLSNEKIIHATETTGRVVVDKIDLGGIISTSLRKRTHNLRVVKRYI